MVDTARCRRVLWPVLTVYWVVMVAAIHWPNPEKTHLNLDRYDKAVHAMLYGTLALLLAAVVEMSPRFQNSRTAVAMLRRCMWVVLAIAVHGYLDELTQPLTNRSYDLWDLAADITGASVAVGLWLTWSPLWLRRAAKPI